MIYMFTEAERATTTTTTTNKKMCSMQTTFEETNRRWVVGLMGVGQTLGYLRTTTRKA